MGNYIKRIFWITLAYLVSLLLVTAETETINTNNDFLDYDIISLGNLESSLVNRKLNKVKDSASAVFVISSEDIRRSGAQSVPEVLRLVPGIYSVQTTKNTSIVTSRGFPGYEGRFVNKMLVLVDGRSIYTPLWSGVLWETQDFFFEDIERIEVVRGAGTTMWGSNAVNGIINIVTKNSAKTHGILATTAIGNEDKTVGLRYGAKINDDDLHYRLYAKGFSKDGSVLVAGGEAHDEHEMLIAGYRLDWNQPESKFLFLSEAFFLEKEEVFSFYSPSSPYYSSQNIDIPGQGLHVLTRYDKELSLASSYSLQLYYDWTNIEWKLLRENRKTYDLDFQHNFPVFEKFITNNISWGFGYRYSEDKIESSYTIRFDPASEELNLSNFFIQDEILFIPDTLFFILGAKFEHNDYSNWELQPSTKILCHLNDSHTVWATSSQATRSPSRVEHDIMQVNGLGGEFLGNPFFGVTLGNKNIKAEKIITYEAGHRYSSVNKMMLDSTVFYNKYKNLKSFDIYAPSPMTCMPSNTAPPCSSDEVLTTMYGSFNNNGKGESYGFETVLEFWPLEAWHLQFAYTYFYLTLTDSDSRGVPGNDYSPNKELSYYEKLSPRYMASLFSTVNINLNWEFSSWFLYKGRTEHTPDNILKSHFILDSQLAWQISREFEIALIGKNLLKNKRKEYAYSKNEMERSFLLKCTYNY
jgi:iron complex outermembrane recepter protein